jgi:hypothetical protein
MAAMHAFIIDVALPTCVLHRIAISPQLCPICHNFVMSASTGINLGCGSFAY